MLLARLNVSLAAFLNIHSHAIPLIPLFLILCVSTNARLLQARDGVTNAWNGHSDVTVLDDYSSQHFSPYYIPTGSVSLDDADPNVAYTPNDSWATSSHSALIERTMHVTSTAGAKAEVTFEGVGK
jgi:hypothetical protein